MVWIFYENQLFSVVSLSDVNDRPLNADFFIRSKKDRKEQKSNFRDFVKTVEDGETFYEKMVINKREVMEIETWSQKKQYDAICRVKIIFCENSSFFSLAMN